MIGLPEASCLLAARCCPRHQRAASLARAHSQRTSRLAFTLAPRLHTSQVRFNGHEDPMTFGSASVGADVDFPLASHLYGLPERAMDLALPPTLGREPYRLMNLDVFEYEVTSVTAAAARPFLLQQSDMAAVCSGSGRV